MDSKKSAPKNNATFLLNEETYHFMFEQHSAIMLLIEAGTGNILEANQAAVNFYGHPKSKLCSMSIQEIIIFSPEPGIGEFQNAINPNQDHLVFIHRLANGDERIVEVHSSSIVLKKKQLIFSINQEITECRHAEDAPRESDARFRYMADTAPVLLWQSGADALCDYFNQPWLDFTGRTMEQELGNGWADGVHPDDYQRCLTVYQSAFKVRSKFTMDYRLRRADGEYRWMLDNGAPRFTTDGLFIGYIGSCVDITERIEAIEAMRVREEHFREVLENSTDVPYKRDLNTNIYEYLSPVFFRISGYTVDEMKTLPMETVLNLIHTEDIPEVTSVIEKAKMGDVGVAHQVDFRFRHKNGGIRWFHDQFTILKNQQGQPTALIGSVSDITDRKRAEEIMQMNAANFRNLAESTPDAILIVSEEGLHVYANQHASDQLGYPLEELLKTQLRDLADPSAYPILQQRLADRIAGRPVPNTYETIVRRKDGSKFPAEVTGTRTIWQGQPSDLVIFRDISGRKLAEAALQESEYKLRSLFDLLPVGVSVLNADNNVIYVNPALENILGINHAALLQGEYRQRTYLHSDGTRMPVDEFASVRATREQRPILNVETGVVKENGQIVWTNVNAVPLDLPEWSIVVTTTDITLRKNAEGKAAQLAAIVEYSDDIIISKSLDGIILSWNKGAEEVYGYRQDEVIGHSITILTAPGYNDEMDQILEKIRSGAHVARFETLRRRKNGQNVQVSLTISPIRDTQGRIIASSTIGHDITERKRVESQLRQLSSAVEHSPASIIITDVEGRIEYVNPKFTKLNGYEPDEVRGKIPRLLRSDDLSRKVYSEPWQTIQSGKEWRGEFLAHKKGGELYWSSASISPIFDPKGNITHFVAVNEDITARKATEEKIRSLNIELEKLAATDYLTNLPNRRFFMQRGVEEFKRAVRNSHPLALLMLDIDEFKKVNDTYGHEVGDMALQQFVVTLKSALREIDILGRIGGEEFAVLLPDTSLEDAFLSAERVREVIANTTFEKMGKTLSVTTSIGVASQLEDMSGIDELLSNADSALYQAKNAGRNRVVKFENI